MSDLKYQWEKVSKITRFTIVNRKWICYTVTGWYVCTSEIMPKLTKNSVLPLYYQLAESLRGKITGGEYAVGDQLPSERELMSIYDISRNTVRDAIDVLVQDGLVERDHGRGTFVAHPQLQLGLTRLTGFSEDMRERNLAPSSVLLKLEVKIPPEAVAHKLHLLDDEKTLYVERLRLADNLPMAINNSYFSLATCPQLVNEDFGNVSIYNIMETKYNLHIAHAEQTVRACIATQVQADLLKIVRGDPLLVIEGAAYSTDNQPIEYMTQIYRADRYVFSINPVRMP